MLLVWRCTLVCICPCHGGCVEVRGQPLSHFSLSTLCSQEITQVTKFGGKYLDTEPSHQYTGYIIFQFKTFSTAPVWYLLMFPVEFLCSLVLLSLSHSVGANWTANVDNCCLGGPLYSGAKNCDTGDMVYFHLRSFIRICNLCALAFLCLALLGWTDNTWTQSRDGEVEGWV